MAQNVESVVQAPAFNGSIGGAQTWTAGTVITDITVPAADGDPTPDYAVVGTLPAGLSFDTSTRIISGTPTAATSDTITIRATNSEGSADWTVDFTTAPAAVVVQPSPAFSVVIAFQAQQILDALIAKKAAIASEKEIDTQVLEAQKVLDQLNLDKDQANDATLAAQADIVTAATTQRDTLTEYLVNLIQN